MKSCIEAVKEIEKEAINTKNSLHNEVNLLFEKVNQVKDNIIHYCKLNSNSSVLSVKKLVVSPWVKTRDGVTELSSVMTNCIDHIQMSLLLIIY